MDELKRIDVKVFAKSAEGVDTDAFMGVMQRWIQRNAVPGVLIDVADYSHIYHGHGTILVGHEQNISVDYGDGRLGVLVRLKRPAEAALAGRIEAALRLAFKACRLLEEDAAFGGKLKFDPSSFVLVTNDRLVAPNDDASFAALKPAVETAAKAVYAGLVAVERSKNDPRERMTVRVTASKPVALAALAGV